MITLTSEKLDQMRQVLEKEKQSVEAQMQTLVSQDPYSDSARLNDNADQASEASEESDHDRFAALVETLTKRLSLINDALMRIGNGSYGLCTNCGQPIDPHRLEILPTATLCLSCEEKKR